MAFNARGLISINLNPEDCVKTICISVVVWNLWNTSPFACKQSETCVAMAGNLDYMWYDRKHIEISIIWKTKIHFYVLQFLSLCSNWNKYRPVYERNSNSVALVVFSAPQTSMYVAQRMKSLGNWPSGSTFLSSVTRLRGREKRSYLKIPACLQFSFLFLFFWYVWIWL